MRKHGKSMSDDDQEAIHALSQIGGNGEALVISTQHLQCRSDCVGAPHVFAVKRHVSESEALTAAHYEGRSFIEITDGVTDEMVERAMTAFWSPGYVGTLKNNKFYDEGCANMRRAIEAALNDYF